MDDKGNHITELNTYRQLTDAEWRERAQETKGKKHNLSEEGS